MSNKQNDHYNETVMETQEPVTKIMANVINQINDKVKYAGKTLCKVCGEQYHPDKFDMCWNCYSKQLPLTTKKYEKISK